jgi:hypothetical protein
MAEAAFNWQRVKLQVARVACLHLNPRRSVDTDL